MKIVQSIYALAEPKLKTPMTSDMSDIVDAFRRNDLIRPVPSAFKMHDGTMIMHPIVYAAFQKKLRIISNAIQAATDERMLTGYW